MAQQIKKNINSVKSTAVDEIKEDTNIEMEEALPKVEKIVKDTKDEEIEILRKENEEKDKKLDELSKNFALMQEQLAKLMSQPSMPSKSKDDDEDVLIGCRNIYGGCLATNDGRYSYTFTCDEEKYIAAEDLKIILRESGRNTRGLFEEDVFYFVNPDDYAKFKIKKRIDLSPENIVRILTTKNTHDMIDEINIITNNKVNFSALHSLQFAIVKLLIDKSNPLADWNYESRVVLERYLGQKFDDLMAAVGALELIPRLKK